MSELHLTLPDELVDQVADRVAAILGECTPSDDGAGYLDVAGAAEFLACPSSGIYALVSAQRLPCHRDGSRLLFDRTELRAYVLNGGAKRP